MYFVYVLKSEVGDRLYKGLTKNIDKRLKEHTSGKMKSTKGYTPWVLVYHEKIETRIEARKTEKFLKSGVGREFLKKHLNL